MYYYIFEPPQGSKEHERNAQIKELLSTLGIAGEMVTPIPGRSIEQLVNLAITKRYSTVVAVGGINLINQTARALEPYDAVFGIIPTIEQGDISQLIKVSDWKNAAEQLKRRRFRLFHQGVLNGQTYFLTPATIHVPEECAFTLDTPEFTLKGQGGIITVTPQHIGQAEGVGACLSIDIRPTTTQRGGFLQSLFGRQKQAPQESYFSVSSFGLSTDATLPVQIADTSLISTPITCAMSKKDLKLIVGKEA